MLAPLFFVINIWKEIRKILNDPVLMGTKGFLAFNGKLILRAIGAVVRALWTTINDLFFGLPGAIVKGLASAGNAIFGALAQPFKDFWAWLGKWFLGQSPSTLGLLIVKGLEAVQSMLINLLVSPFKMAWNLIKEIPFVGGLFNNIGTAVGNLVRPTVTADKVTSAPDSAIRANDIKATIIPSNEEVLKKLDMVVVAIDKLTAGFASGNLRAVVSIDGQRIDVATGRALEFRGALV
jgi:hypothetical protein